MTAITYSQTKWSKTLAQIFPSSILQVNYPYHPKFHENGEYTCSLTYIHEKACTHRMQDTKIGIRTREWSARFWNLFDQLFIMSSSGKKLRLQ